MHYFLIHRWSSHPDTLKNNYLSCWSVYTPNLNRIDIMWWRHPIDISQMGSAPQTVDFSVFFLKQSYCLLGRTPCVFPSKSDSGAQHTHPELQSCCAGKISQETWMVKWKNSCRISTKSDVSNRAGGRPTECCSGQREVSRRLANSLRFSRSNPNICLVLVLLGRRMQW